MSSSLGCAGGPDAGHATKGVPVHQILRHWQAPLLPQHAREVPADAPRVVWLLLGHEVVDRALRAEGLAVRDLPSAAAPAGRPDLDQ